MRMKMTAEPGRTGVPRVNSKPAAVNDFARAARGNAPPAAPSDDPLAGDRKSATMGEDERA
ncbi:MAG: hypothetical protein CMJ88_06335 [Planctomycetes bacterium]|nr:hypothetical protein [Planctomycetota bacterium]